MMRRWHLALAATGILLPTFRLSDVPTLSAQEAPPVRAHLLGDPVPGRDAPAFSLPYATARGPGPEDQPFILRAELGRVVVLAFCAEPADNAALELMRSFAARHDALFAGEVVVAVVVPEGVDRAAARASEMALPYKLLADRDERVRRMFGVDRRDLAVYVIGQDGRVAWRELRFSPFLATSYDRLGEVVREAARR
jgi:peroxiredoxin